jgi:riboflavin kinase/FMN adenylyltransferase
MIIVKNIEELKKLINTYKVNITIGNFDGVHLGHHDFLKEIKEISNQEENTRFVVITFIPHPAQALKGQSGFLINSFEERRELVGQVGVDYLLEVDFTRDFSSLSPKEFIENYICTFSKIQSVYLGYDFSFGANKSGDHSLAKEIFAEKNIALCLQKEFKLNDCVVSSSVIRAALRIGNVDRAAELLGRNYFLSGRVIKGQGRGKQIGFPTANMGYDRDVLLPSKGVYLTQTQIHDMVYFSVTNIGANPTFNSEQEIHVETHLLNFSRDIYGDEVKVFFFKKMREEKKFQTVNELVAQIKADVECAEEMFKIK